MPTYLYECENCGRFEEFQNINDPALKKCPKCGAPVKRIIGTPGIIFKGSGFYVNDSKQISNKGIKEGKKKVKEKAKEEKKEKVS
jgi:putative FmdB family regulatory protein